MRLLPVRDRLCRPVSLLKENRSRADDEIEGSMSGEHLPLRNLPADTGGPIKAAAGEQAGDTSMSDNIF